MKAMKSVYSYKSQGNRRFFEDGTDALRAHVAEGLKSA